MNLKRIGVLTVVFTVLLLLYSCSKDDTRLRVKNIDGLSYLYDIEVGPLDFGRVDNGESTSYKGITDGTHDISYRWGGTGTKIDGKITISGTGKYTLKLSTLSYSLEKD